MNGSRSVKELRIALPKGHLEQEVLKLLEEAGIGVSPSARCYRPNMDMPAVDAKFLKPQDIVEMLHVGRRDLGFAGADWVVELGADLVEIVDTGFNPVRLVAAAPAGLLNSGKLPSRPLVVASEYERLARKWIAHRGLDATFVRCYGAAEVFPPEDADVVIDNTATGATLSANRLEIVEVLMTSTTRLYVSKSAWEDPQLQQRIKEIEILLRSVLEARERVMVEVNVPEDRLTAVVDLLPAMRRPTVAPLFQSEGFSVRAAIPRDRLSEVIPAIKAAGATDVVVSQPSQIVP